MYGLFIIDGCTIFSDTLDITRSQIFRAHYQLPICKEPAKKALYYQQMSWLDEYNDDTYEYDDSYYDYYNDQPYDDQYYDDQYHDDYYYDDPYYESNHYESQEPNVEQSQEESKN